MRGFVISLLLAAVIWGGLPFVQVSIVGKGAAAFADSGSSSGSDDDDSDDDDDDDSGGSSSGGSGSGGSGSSGNSGGSSSSSNDDRSASARAGELFGRDGITISFADGHVEQIRDDRFETLDVEGRVIDAHTARRADVDRLRSIGKSAKRRGGSRSIRTIVEISDRGRSIEVTDSRGWREIVTRGAYVVKDPNGQTVARRPVTAADIIRIRDTLALD